MRVKIFVYDGNEWVEQTPCNSAEFDERLDEQIDTGSVQLLSAVETPFPDFCTVKMLLNDGKEEKELCYRAFDAVEKRGAGYYVHTLELVEPTRELMGVLIDGIKFTQPIEGEKLSLKEALTRISKKAVLLPKGFGSDEVVFLFDWNKNPSVSRILDETVSPEFHWESETSLWEVLCDVGNVINCIPRLYIVAPSSSAPYKVLTFDKVNDVTGEYEL